MGRLSTHVLDTVHGTPAANVVIEWFAMDGSPRLLGTARTNDDGRTDAALLEGDRLLVGRYRLLFHVGDYFRRRGLVLPSPAFLDVVTVDFGVADASANYHVPLVCSPWTYATYRGS
ncbi:MAG: hydroxyisourate hydrolase [Burkholderiales bacterium]|nr:hydroxyisourate hydrolase [Pseudomonadota bacterium]MCC7067298.1 hydroxyisourate hydrolase [Burkholderiales bacterium]MCZ2136005.1 hydroxyisourate hydrolase [Burkholderiales bacterium]